MKTYWVYILRCANTSLYVGVTSNLEQRLHRHMSGYFTDSFTSDRLPAALVYSAEFSSIHEAINREKQLKRWSKAKKEALIRGEFEKLSKLAKKRFYKISLGTPPLSP